MANKPAKDIDETAAEAPAPEKKVCGIVMPISTMSDDYTEDHWNRVRLVLERAIEKAGMRAQLVWQNPAVDVIQAAILQNIYENDVVICDVSGLNPNVMLEAGLRLSTRRPTIIVTDRVVKPPFDINTVGYIDYRRDLEYNETDRFITRLADKINAVSAAAADGTYRSFVENYRFETVEPSKVSVPAEEVLARKVDNLTKLVMRLDSRNRADSIAQSYSNVTVDENRRDLFILKANMGDWEAFNAIITKEISPNHFTVRAAGRGTIRLVVSYVPWLDDEQLAAAKSKIRGVLSTFQSILDSKNDDGTRGGSSGPEDMFD